MASRPNVQSNEDRLIARYPASEAAEKGRRRLATAGWAVPSWPARWGGQGLPAWADEVVATELTPALMLDAMRSGVSECIAEPVTADSVGTAEALAAE